MARASEVDVINHGKQTHWIGDVALVPGVVRLDKSIWQDIKGKSSVLAMLDEGQLEVRKDIYAGKDGKKRKEYSDIGYKNFAQERHSPPTPEGTKDPEWLSDQIDMLLNLSNGNVNTRSEAVSVLSSQIGLSESEIARKV